MENLRKRVPFKFTSDSTSSRDESEILDDQGCFLTMHLPQDLTEALKEQEELIQGLRDESRAANEQYILVVQVTLALSTVL